MTVAPARQLPPAPGTIAERSNASAAAGPAILSMPSANLELVRSIYAAWESGDFSSADWADTAIEYVLVDGPQPGRWTGVAEMAAAWRSFAEVWGYYRVQADEYRELDDERVLVLIHSSVEGKISGTRASQARAEGANLFHIRDGRVRRLVVGFSREHVLADLGRLPEDEAADSSD